MAAEWLKDTVFYEIYPQSFKDSNGDGIGDINGIIQKLEYIKSLGCNAVWINPCYDSPFKDAGYDVRDYKKLRRGTERTRTCTNSLMKRIKRYQGIAGPCAWTHIGRASLVPRKSEGCEE